MAETKTALVTGTTSGIGREVAKGLLARGYTVVAHGRSAEKLKGEVARWPASAGQVQTVLGDLSSKADVVRLADEVLTRFPRLDLLVHNAAVVPQTRAQTADGLNACFATNALAPFVLSRRLRPALEAAGASRVIYFWGGGQNTFDLEDLQSKKTPYDGYADYSQSKNACALLAQESVRQGAGKGVSTFAVLPGLVNTEGMQSMNNLFSKVGAFFFRTPAQGARTPLWVATEPGLEARSGTCFGSLLGGGWRKETKLPANAKDPVLAPKVWAVCEQLAGG